MMIQPRRDSDVPIREAVIASLRAPPAGPGTVEFRRSGCFGPVKDSQCDSRKTISPGTKLELSGDP